MISVGCVSRVKASVDSSEFRISSNQGEKPPIFKKLSGFKVLSQSASRFLTKNYTQMKEYTARFTSAYQTLETNAKKR